MSDNQTAVEWLVEQVYLYPGSGWPKAIEQALAMEKDQIVEAYNAGQAKEASQCFWTKGNLYFDNIYGGHN